MIWRAAKVISWRHSKTIAGKNQVFCSRMLKPQECKVSPIRDESDPLNLFLGDTLLKNAFAHEAEGEWSVRKSKSGQRFVFLLNIAIFKMILPHGLYIILLRECVPSLRKTFPELTEYDPK